jgi:hypothetical protein
MTNATFFKNVSGGLIIPRAQKICEVVYTDNSKVDRNHIQQIYYQYFPNHISVAILLDIYILKQK